MSSSELPFKALDDDAKKLALARLDELRRMIEAGQVSEYAFTLVQAGTEQTFMFSHYSNDGGAMIMATVADNFRCHCNLPECMTRDIGDVLRHALMIYNGTAGTVVHRAVVIDPETNTKH